jgi:hypothetical protein
MVASSVIAQQSFVGIVTEEIGIVSSVHQSCILKLAEGLINAIRTHIKAVLIMLQDRNVTKSD